MSCTNTSKEIAAKVKAMLCQTPKPTQEEVANLLGVSRSLVSDIVTGRCHTDVPWPDGHQPVNVAGGQSTSDNIEDRVKELEANLLHTRQELSRERRRADGNAKSHGLFLAMTDVLEEKLCRIDPLPPAREWKLPACAIQEHCVLHLSDGHHDEVITPEETGGLETYDFPISCCRAEKLVNTTIDWTQGILTPTYYFTDLWVLAYGDHTSGEIHNHETRSYFRNQFKNSLAIGKLHSLMYRDLAAHFDRVHVVYVPGNHGRRTPKKDHHGAQQNWDYMIGKIAQIHCENLPNVDFIIPNAFSVNLDINGVGFHVFHGDDVTGWQGMPYYGLKRRATNLSSLSQITQSQRIRYFCCGHFHSPTVINNLDGELMVNGPWAGCNAYSYNSFAGYTEPSQWLHGVNPNHGVTWRLGIHLKDSKAEKKGPERYKIEV